MSRPPRLKTFSYVGHYRYFLTTCTFDRQPLLTDSDVVALVRSQLERSSERNGVAVVAYCAMPDHIHVLAVGLTDTSDMKRFMDRWKQQSGFVFKRGSGRRLWQDGYYDHVLREEDDIGGVIAYIVNNPVRAKLVDSPAEYPFWGSLTHSRNDILDFIAGVPEWKKPQ